MSTKLKCRLVGCSQLKNTPICGHCETDVYGGYIDLPQAKLYPLMRLWWKIKRFTWPRCSHCGKLMFKNRYDKYFCSRDCSDAWIPF